MGMVGTVSPETVRDVFLQYPLSSGGYSTIDRSFLASQTTLHPC